MGENISIKKRISAFKELSSDEKHTVIKEFLINNSLYILLIAAIIGIQIYQPRFLSLSSIINILSLSAANLPTL